MELVSPSEKSPAIPLEPGENWRFHFDMTRCVGCKCCEVACHEQNANPPGVKWRRVGEMEGGVFPDTKHLFVSMACNHCLEPPCLEGCPVDAYHKDPATGVVHLDAQVCIGCQYCTWNCPYGAPQFDERRGVATKCDLCHNRLSAGDLPACVAVCPTGAIEIEAFRPEQWRTDLTPANAPGLPDASLTISATRISTPEAVPEEFHRIDTFRLAPEKAHYSLILLTVFTQLAVGGFASLVAVEWAGRLGWLATPLGNIARDGAWILLAVANLALAVSVFHLGRPLYAWRALKMWRRSWLSREVLLFSLFTGSATLYALLGWQERLPVPAAGRLALGGLVLILGLLGIYASARIYRVPARPSWDTPRTPVAFFATAFLLGPLVVLLLLLGHESQWSDGARVGVAGLVVALLALAGFVQLGAILVKLLHMLQESEPELLASARLLTGRFRKLFLARLGGLLLGLLFLPLSVLATTPVMGDPMGAPWITGALALLLLGSELVGRYLFFVTVVPKNRPEGYA